MRRSRSCAHGAATNSQEDCWGPGRSGNPSGRPKAASFEAALATRAATPVADREEMSKIAKSIGLDPERAQNIDVVAALFYAALSRSLLRAVTVAAN